MLRKLLLPLLFVTALSTSSVAVAQTPSDCITPSMALTQLQQMDPKAKLKYYYEDESLQAFLKGLVDMKIIQEANDEIVRIDVMESSKVEDSYFVILYYRTNGAICYNTGFSEEKAFHEIVRNHILGEMVDENDVHNNPLVNN